MKRAGATLPGVRPILPLALLLAACADPDGAVRSAGSGGETGADSGADSGTDSGADSGTDSGDSGTDSGDSGTDSGADTAPPDPPPLRVAVVSDLNGSYGSTTYRDEVDAAVDALLADPPDLVLSTGDMVAGQRSGLDYPAMWAAFHATVSDRLAAAGIPFAVTPGNHDASGYSGYEAERAAFADAWRDRVPAVDLVDADDFPFRYAFLVGDTLFVSLDDTLVGPLDGEQVDWLDRVLDTPAAARVVYGHVPLYPFAEGRETEALFDPDLEALLVDHDVTAFVSGHHHAYYPGRRGALRLVGTACLGDSPRALIGTDADSPRSVLRFEIDDGAILSLDAYGGARFDTPVDRATLPTSVGSGDERIDRDDR